MLKQIYSQKWEPFENENLMEFEVIKRIKLIRIFMTELLTKNYEFSSRLSNLKDSKPIRKEAVVKVPKFE